MFKYLFYINSTLETIGNENKVSRERIRQIIASFEEKNEFQEDVCLNNFDFYYSKYEYFKLNNLNVSKNFFNKVLKNNKIYLNKKIWVPRIEQLKKYMKEMSYQDLVKLDFKKNIINEFTLNEVLNEFNGYNEKKLKEKWKIVVQKMIVENKKIVEADIDFLVEKFNLSKRALIANLERYSLQKDYNIIKFNTKHFIYFEKTLEKEELIKNIINIFLTWEQGIYHNQYILKKYQEELSNIEVYNSQSLDSLIEMYIPNESLKFISYPRAPYIQNKNYGKIQASSTANSDFILDVIIRHNFKNSNEVIHYLETNFGWKKETLMGNKEIQLIKELIEM